MLLSDISLCQYRTPNSYKKAYHVCRQHKNRCSRWRAARCPQSDLFIVTVAVCVVIVSVIGMLSGR